MFLLLEFMSTTTIFTILFALMVSLNVRLIATLNPEGMGYVRAQAMMMLIALRLESSGSQSVYRGTFHRALYCFCKEN